MYKNQKLFNDIVNLLNKYNFKLLKFERIVYATENEYYQYKFKDDSYGIITMNKFKNKLNNTCNDTFNNILIDLLKERDEIIKELYQKNINNYINYLKLLTLNKNIIKKDNLKY